MGYDGQGKGFGYFKKVSRAVWVLIEGVLDYDKNTIWRFYTVSVTPEFLFFSS